MSLLDDVRTALRGRSQALDSDIVIYINAALYDLQRAGVDVTDLWKWNTFSFVDGKITRPDDAEPECPPEIKTAVILYVKSRFGNTDTAAKESFWKAYENWRLTLVLDGDKVLEG